MTRGPHDDDTSPPRGAPDRASPPGDAPDRASPPRDERGERPLRLFVALDLPDAARAALAAVGAASDPGIWRALAAETLHVTLAFLGARPPADVATIEPLVAALDGRPAPRLALKRVLGLPPRRSRVLTVELEDPDATLTTLQADLARELTAAGVFTPEKRPFRPHVTVARLRPRMRAPRDTPELQPLAFDATSVTLYRSQTHPGGARYEPLARARLG